MRKKIHLITITAFTLLALTSITTSYAAHTYEQTLKYPTGYFLDENAAQNNYPYYRWWDDDWGWTHSCPTDIWIESASLEIHSWDVDYDSGERDEIYLDDNSAGYLTGSTNNWSTTTFDVPYEYLSDGWLGVWMDIDVYKTGWAVTLNYSKLTVNYFYVYEIDIKPGSWPNSFNVKQKGVLPIAILTTDSFDATTLDPETVQARYYAGPIDPLRWSYEDVDGDGDIDLILHYDSQEIAATLPPDAQDGEEHGCLVHGVTFSGEEYIGRDTLRVLIKGK